MGWILLHLHFGANAYVFQPLDGNRLRGDLQFRFSMTILASALFLTLMSPALLVALQTSLRSHWRNLCFGTRFPLLSVTLSSVLRVVRHDSDFMNDVHTSDLMWVHG